MERGIAVKSLVSECLEVYGELMRRKLKIFLEEPDEVNLTMVPLIFCLMNENDFDPALIIHNEMLEKITIRKYGFFFPSLVTRLCRLAGVPKKNSDVFPAVMPKLRAD
ncbi:hypothetical protein RND71_038484 [Anisodus tanguticus]|uniref:Uncharacterized protein n=1 Tax=Anisodus tanguticus TaxID=243964 RepID=A0AAE1US57_9SOLA|nr:hypothetical protein RND71_038484 [Anisodus tanguticus]